MEDVVAVAVRLEDGTERFFITWGRLQDATDPAPLARVVLENAHRFSIGGTPVGARVCSSLSEARDEPYFYEGLVSIASRAIPFGEDYEVWRKNMIAALEAGNELYCLGARDDPTVDHSDVEVPPEKLTLCHPSVR